MYIVGLTPGFQGRQMSYTDVKIKSFNVRLTEKEIGAIIKTAKDIFGKDNISIYLFGSRTDKNKKGGDIDLYIEMKTQIALKDMLNKKIKFKIALHRIIGEQKIDIIIPTTRNKNIIKEAKETGVLLYG